MLRVIRVSHFLHVKDSRYAGGCCSLPKGTPPPFSSSQSLALRLRSALCRYSLGATGRGRRRWAAARRTPKRSIARQGEEGRRGEEEGECCVLRRDFSSLLPLQGITTAHRAVLLLSASFVLTPRSGRARLRHANRKRTTLLFRSYSPVCFPHIRIASLCYHVWW